MGGLNKQIDEYIKESNKRIDEYADESNKRIDESNKRFDEYADDTNKMIKNMKESIDTQYQEMIKMVNIIKLKLNSTNGVTDEIYENLNKLHKSIQNKSDISDIINKFSDFNDNIDNIVKPIINKELDKITTIIPQLITKDEFKTQLEQYSKSIDEKLDKIPMLTKLVKSMGKQYDDMSDIILTIKNKIKDSLNSDSMTTIDELKTLIDSKSSKDDIYDKLIEFENKIDNIVKSNIKNEMNLIDKVIPTLINRKELEKYIMTTEERFDEYNKVIANIRESIDMQYDKMIKIIEVIKNKMSMNTKTHIPSKIYDTIDQLYNMINMKSNISDIENKFSDFNNSIDTKIKSSIINEIKQLNDIIPSLVTKEELKNGVHKNQNNDDGKLDEYIKETNKRFDEYNEMINTMKKSMDRQYEEMINIVDIMKRKINTNDVPPEIYSTIGQLQNLINTKSNISDITNKFEEFNNMIDTKIKNNIMIEIKQFSDIIPSLVTKTDMDKIVKTLDNKINDIEKILNSLKKSINTQYDEMIKMVDIIKIKLRNTNGITDEIYDNLNKLQKLIDRKSNISDIENKFMEFNNNINGIIKPLISKELDSINMIIPLLVTKDDFKSELNQYKDDLDKYKDTIDNKIKMIPELISKIPILGKLIETMSKQYDEIRESVNTMEKQLGNKPNLKLPKQIKASIDEIKTTDSSKMSLNDIIDKLEKIEQIIPTLVKNDDFVNYTKSIESKMEENKVVIDKIINSIDVQFNDIIKLINIIKNKTSDDKFSQEIYNNINELQKLVNNKSNIIDVENKFSEFYNNINNMVKPIITKEIYSINETLPKLVTNIELKTQLDQYKSIIDATISQYKEQIKTIQNNNITEDVYSDIQILKESIILQFEEMIKISDIIKKKTNKMDNITNNIYNDFDMKISNSVDTVKTIKDNMTVQFEEMIKIADIVKNKTNKMDNINNNIYNDFDMKISKSVDTVKTIKDNMTVQFEDMIKIADIVKNKTNKMDNITQNIYNDFDMKISHSVNTIKKIKDNMTVQFEEMIKVVDIIKSKLNKTDGVTKEIYDNMNELQRLINSKANINDITMKFGEFTNNIDNMIKLNTMTELNKMTPLFATKEELSGYQKKTYESMSPIINSIELKLNSVGTPEVSKTKLNEFKKSVELIDDKDTLFRKCNDFKEGLVITIKKMIDKELIELNNKIKSLPTKKEQINLLDRINKDRINKDRINKNRDNKNRDNKHRDNKHRDNKNNYKSIEGGGVNRSDENLNNFKKIDNILTNNFNKQKDIMKNIIKNIMNKIRQLSNNLDKSYIKMYKYAQKNLFILFNFIDQFTINSINIDTSSKKIQEIINYYNDIISKKIFPYEISNNINDMIVNIDILYNIIKNKDEFNNLVEILLDNQIKVENLDHI